MRSVVIDYYRTNEEKGWKVRHHVGVSVANTLMNNKQYAHAINLLNVIYYSPWAAKRQLDIVAMTVYLKGYAALKSIEGVQWVVQQVLQGDILINRRFLDTLKSSLGFFEGSPVRQNESHGPENDAVQHIRDLRQECMSAFEGQKRETKAFGIQLIQCIAKWSVPEASLEQRQYT